MPASILQALHAHALYAVKYTHRRPHSTGHENGIRSMHVAVIMHGNSQWAIQRGLPSTAGHAAGVAAL